MFTPAVFSATLCSLVTVFGALSISAASPQAVVQRHSDAFPDFVVTYAPYTYLHSKETYWPSDIAVHIQHVVPEINNTVIDPHVTLENVASYGSNVYLTSPDDQSNSDYIDWMLSAYGKPGGNGTAASAPATIIVVEKDGGIFDAFYIYFYSYNYGPEVGGMHMGNHVGDWEYNMVRFINGEPTYIYYSEHSSGAAFDFSAVQKNSGRPLNYAAIGSHANYATIGEQYYEPGDHSEVPHDTTDAGFYWDVTQNYRGYWYNVSSQAFTSSGGAGQGAELQAGEGVDWLKFAGKWGDQQWDDSRSGQFCSSIGCHISDGPTGPFTKNLGRTAVCENESSCTIQSSI